ncbi:MAG: EAL domain-containing protein [Sphingomonadaceae bacterium]
MQNKLSGWMGLGSSAPRPMRLDKTQAATFCDTYESLDLGGFWSTDSDGNLTYLSPNVAAILAPGEHLGGKPFLELLRATTRGKQAHASLPMALARRNAFSEIVLETGNGENRQWWSLSGRAQYNAAKEFVGFVGFFADVTRERSSAEENAELANKDSLTGLVNRRHMGNLLEREMTSCKARELPCSLLLIDLDRFKHVNDTLGHSAGDALLQQVAERLVAIVGDKTRVCRPGGDEFQVILPEVEDRGALGELAESIISGLSQAYSVDGNRCSIGASIGMAVSPFDGTTPEDLIRNADLALYAAKHSGRGRFRFFSGDLLKSAEDRRRLEVDLQDAIANGELELHYQPVVDALTNEAIGAETLIRWNHPKDGNISPAVFIPIAEESSLICRIGEWVLRNACQDAANWPQGLRLAVNVSPVQFAEESLPGIVASALASSGLDPDRLELEITESVFVREGNGTDAMFKALKALGVRLALDDFGTGYSSLSYLKTAPFDKIKIDQSFVRGATQEGSRNADHRGHRRASPTRWTWTPPPRGSSPEDQLAMIRELGVTLVQGHIYSKALPNTEFVENVSDGNWVIEPEGPSRQRDNRFAMYRTIGAVHEDHYYPVVLRNLSRSGALIEGLLGVPADTQFVLDFGEGQLAVATVKRAMRDSQGVEFETPLVNDGNGGLCTRHRVSSYHLAQAGLPNFIGEYVPDEGLSAKSGKVKLPSFSTKREWLRFGSRGDAAA